ncbi:hypothetical protein GSI_06270 [Ganoderma sinense ZZ0214-1]|uniref:WW domain-containing protein n=1 Tax=Ganoderma sinense ZZ0214-1 TaxID=1077348 RepID=A0A2G8SD99_9APHY|nr:hypothetical protein GSI_06270 [Ganoderma sinense ZZ0214-1]
MSSDYHTLLPDGWVREVDPKTRHPFWVDTSAEPPRSIWVHPYEDEQFLREHPDIRECLARELRTSDQPPPYTPRRHSFSGPTTTTGSAVPEGENAMRTSQSQPETPKPSQQRRGFFGKLKDKAIGTKEERDARRREEEQWQHHVAEMRSRRQQEEIAALRDRGWYPQYGSAPYGAGMYGQPVYGAPAGDPYGVGGRRHGGFGGGGIGLPLLAGAAGGLLLGYIIANDFDGGGFGGGGFDGGGFDGGWGGGGFF